MEVGHMFRKVMYSSSQVVSLVVEIYATDNADTSAAFALKKTVKATPPPIVLSGT